MCVPGLDPVTLALMAGSAALSAGGALVNGYEANQTQNRMVEERNAATRQELARQQRYQQEAGDVFRQSIDRFQPEEQAKVLADNQSVATQNFQTATPTATDLGAFSSPNAPRVVKEQADRK